jgi:hypothetical protein
MFEPGRESILIQPVSWFAATHAAVAGRVIATLPTPDLPERLAIEESRLRTQYQDRLPHLTALALRGTGVLLGVLTLTLAIYLRNAKRLQVMPERPGSASGASASRLRDRLAAVLAGRPATRAGLLFFVRTLVGSPAHRIYITASIGVGMALVITLAPDVWQAGGSTTMRTSELAAQTLLLTVIVAGLRGAIRTSADPRAAWIFVIAETGTLREFRTGVRRGMMATMFAAVLLLTPVHAAAWGISLAAMHAATGLALAWLLVEAACASVEQPLVQTIPPNDGLNTVGVVLLGALVIVVLVLSRIELAALSTIAGTAAFAGVALLTAACLGYVNEQNHRASSLPAIAPSTSLPGPSSSK